MVAFAQATTCAQDFRGSLQCSRPQATRPRRGCLHMTCPGGEASAQKAPGAAPTHRGQCRNGFLDLGQDHVPVDVSGCTLVQCLAPRAPEKRRHWSGARPAPPRPVTAGGPVGPSAALAPGPQPTCSHMPPRQGPRRPPPAGPHGHSPPASSWWRAPSTGSVTARGTGSPAGSGRVAGCGGGRACEQTPRAGSRTPAGGCGGRPGHARRGLGVHVRAGFCTAQEGVPA